MGKDFYLKQTMIIIASVIILLYLFLGFRIYSVEGSSMSPRLEPGDIVLVYRWSYGFPRLIHSGYLFQWKDPSINDIIVFHSPGEQTLSVKRCRGRIGDLLVLNHDIFYINGIPLPAGRTPPAGSFRNGFISRGWVFLLGDNVNESIDSRYYGPLSLEYVIGKVLLTGEK